jgi:hypothetical protein
MEQCCFGSTLGSGAMSAGTFCVMVGVSPGVLFCVLCLTLMDTFCLNQMLFCCGVTQLHGGRHIRNSCGQHCQRCDRHWGLACLLAHPLFLTEGWMKDVLSCTLQLLNE